MPSTYNNYLVMVLIMKMIMITMAMVYIGTYPT